MGNIISSEDSEIEYLEGFVKKFDQMQKNLHVLQSTYDDTLTTKESSFENYKLWIRGLYETAINYLEKLKLKKKYENSMYEYKYFEDLSMKWIDFRQKIFSFIGFFYEKIQNVNEMIVESINFVQVQENFLKNKKKMVKPVLKCDKK